MSNPNINRGPGWNVPALATLLLFVSTEQAGVVTLLNHDEGNPRLIVWFKLKFEL